MWQFFNAQNLPRMHGLKLIGLGCFLVAAVVAGFLGGRYIERGTHSAVESQLETAVQAFRAGDDQTAVSLLAPLARDGNPNAQYWLADLYENGLGVKPDMTAALDLLEKSAAQGFVPAETRLGEVYLRGNETLQDFAKARLWLRRAAVAGDSAAQRELGYVFALGLGVPRDPAEAYGWYENAVLHGDRQAMRLRDRMVTDMSPADIGKGAQIAKDLAAEIKGEQAA